MKFPFLSLSLSFVTLLSLIATTIHGFVVPLSTSTSTSSSARQRQRLQQPRVGFSTTNNASPVSSTDDVDVTSILSNLKQLLEHLQDGSDGGAKLLAASSPSWQAAIHAAVGAPDTADDGLVAHALQEAMARPHNQFAILMGNHDDNADFEAVFPSDPVVDAENKTVWVECQLRELPKDELLVTMGISLVEVNGEYKIDELQWQDFRDAFYPGLSGREWLRAF